MKIAVVAINKEGERIACKLKKSFSKVDIYKTKKKQQDGRCPVRKITEEIFDKEKYEGIIFIAASGIVVRSIAPFIHNKYEDPAVICVDTAGRFAISLLSGHEGGANRLTYKVAAAIDAEPIITTGTEVNKKYILGIGCRKSIEKGKIKRAIERVLDVRNINREAIRLIATVDIKKNEEGLIRACEDFDIPLVFISRDAIKRFNGDYTGSQAARRHLGIAGVCEPCALIAGRRTRLLLPKQVIDGVTIALVKES